MAGLEAYWSCYAYLESNYDEVNGCDFYHELFPDNENSGELHSDYSHPNAIFLYYDEERATQKKKQLSRRIMLRDTWEQDYMAYIEKNPMTLCSGLSYRGRENKLEHAQKMHALIFDLDGVGLRELRTLFLRFGGDPTKLRRLPMPTFLVLSGSGLHIYYVFDEPIDLFPNIKLQLKSLKYDLTFKIWEYKATSKVEHIQYQSINQGFRMVGSCNSKHNNVDIRAFRVGDLVSLEYLNAYASPENRVDLNLRFRPSHCTRAEAAVAYPEWYDRVIVRGEKSRKKWDIAGKVNGADPWALYHWWLAQRNKVRGGHRYFYMMCLAIYGYKCDVPKSVVRRDLNDIFEELQSVAHDNELSRDEIKSALESYDREYYNFTISDIEMLSGIHIPRNRRNLIPQAEHLELARSRKATLKRLGRLKNPDGRPPKKNDVVEWVLKNPNGSKSDCIRATGLSKPTVYKYWDAAHELIADSDDN